MLMKRIAPDNSIADLEMSEADRAAYSPGSSLINPAHLDQICDITAKKIIPCDAYVFLQGEDVLALSRAGLIATGKRANGCELVINQVLGGHTVLGSGIFDLCGPLLPPAGKISGQGNATVLRLADHAGDSAGVPLIKSASNNVGDLEISNLLIDGNKANQVPSTDVARWCNLGIWIIRGESNQHTTNIHDVCVANCISGGIYIERSSWKTNEEHVLRRALTSLDRITCRGNGMLGVADADKRCGIHLDHIDFVNMNNITLQDNVGGGMAIGASSYVNINNVLSSGNVLCDQYRATLSISAHNTYDLEQVSVSNFASLNDSGGLYIGAYDLGDFSPVTRDCNIQMSIVGARQYGAYIRHVTDSDFHLNVTGSTDHGIKVYESTGIRLTGSSRQNGGQPLFTELSEVDQSGLRVA